MLKSIDKKPAYDLNKIKFATDQPTFERAVGLYHSGNVTKFKDHERGFSATVLGGSRYEVFVSNKKYDDGYCDCYLGQENTLCKHMVAVGIHAVSKGKPLSEDDMNFIEGPKSSNKTGELSKADLLGIKAEISGALRFIKSYDGPSRTWFAYQNSLDEGCNRLSHTFSQLPVSRVSAKIIIQTLIKLDNKLCHSGVDDSNGTVGGLIESSALMLLDYAKLVPECRKEFQALEDIDTCFGWEERLISKEAEERKRKAFEKKLNDLKSL